jgi:GT2 family glycosyltransferase
MKSRVSVIIPVLNQFDLVEKTLEYLSQELPRPYELLIIDNGSDVPFETKFPDVKILRIDEPIGSYPTFKVGLQEAEGEILAFFHSDFFVYDKDWSRKVLAEFDKDTQLGMIGFIGSNEIDSAGGRGLGTTSNFQGKRTLKTISLQGADRTYTYWEGSPAAVHGKINAGFTRAAVVDGCCMILRRTALEDIGFRENFGIHHFYDKLISTQLLEKQWKIGVLGIECDHISGQTVNQEQKYKDAVRDWAIKNHYHPGGLGINWDDFVYHYSENYWLKEYRDTKHIIPIKV